MAIEAKLGGTYIEIGGDLSGLDSALNKAVSNTTTASSQISAKLNSVSSAATSTGGAFGKLQQDMASQFAKIREGAASLADAQARSAKASQAQANQVGPLKEGFQGLALGFAQAAGAMAAGMTVVALGQKVFSEVVDQIKFATTTILTAEKSLSELRTVAGYTGANFGILRERLKDTSAELGTTAHLADGVALALRKGIPQEQAVAFVETVARFAKTTKSELIPAIDTVGDALANYGMETSRAREVTDLLTFAWGHFGGDIVGSMSRIFPLAAGLKVPLNELIPTLVTLAESGLGTGKALSGLEATMIALEKPSAALKEKMRGLGIVPGPEAIAQAGGFLAMLKKLTTAAKDEDIAITELFGSRRTLNAVMALSTTAAAELERNLAKARDATHLSTSANEAFESRVKTVGEQSERTVTLLARFWESFVSGKGAVAGLLAELNNVIEAVTRFGALPPGVFETAFGGYLTEEQKKRLKDMVALQNELADATKKNLMAIPAKFSPSPFTIAAGSAIAPPAAVTLAQSSIEKLSRATISADKEQKKFLEELADAATAVQGPLQKIQSEYEAKLREAKKLLGDNNNLWEEAKKSIEAVRVQKILDHTRSVNAELAKMQEQTALTAATMAGPLAEAAQKFQNKLSEIGRTAVEKRWDRATTATATSRAQADYDIAETEIRRKMSSSLSEALAAQLGPAASGARKLMDEVSNVAQIRPTLTPLLQSAADEYVKNLGEKFVISLHKTPIDLIGGMTTISAIQGRDVALPGLTGALDNAKDLVTEMGFLQKSFQELGNLPAGTSAPAEFIDAIRNAAAESLLDMDSLVAKMKSLGATSAMLWPLVQATVTLKEQMKSFQYAGAEKALADFQELMTLFDQLKNLGQLTDKTKELWAGPTLQSLNLQKVMLQLMIDLGDRSKKTATELAKVDLAIKTIKMPSWKAQLEVQAKDLLAGFSSWGAVAAQAFQPVAAAFGSLFSDLASGAEDAGAKFAGAIISAVGTIASALGTLFLLAGAGFVVIPGFQWSAGALFAAGAALIALGGVAMGIGGSIGRPTTATTPAAATTKTPAIIPARSGMSLGPSSSGAGSAFLSTGASTNRGFAMAGSYGSASGAAQSGMFGGTVIQASIFTMDADSFTDFANKPKIKRALIDISRRDILGGGDLQRYTAAKPVR